MQIVIYPHPTLRHKSKPLRRVDAELRAAVGTMLELMYEHQGVGLAANQVDLPYRLFVANFEGDPDVKEAEYVFINPVLSQAQGSEESEEGCLSLPELRGQVKRARKVTINAYTLDGEEVSAELIGFPARVVQHENDHLDGRLFIDRLSPTQFMEVRETLHEFEVDFQSKRERGHVPDDEEIAVRLKQLEELRA